MWVSCFALLGGNWDFDGFAAAGVEVEKLGDGVVAFGGGLDAKAGGGAGGA